MMKRIIVLALLTVLLWRGYAHFRQQQRNPSAAQLAAMPVLPQAMPIQAATEPVQFRCDGRIYCSQMNSCAEANFFLKNCPGVKMDGDGNGIPCEKQWCGH